MHRQFPDFSSEKSNDIDKIAIEWLIKQDRGLTPEEQDDYFQWLADDPRHSERILKHKQRWQSLDKLVQWCPEHSSKPNPDLLATWRHWLRGWQIPAVGAVAAALIFGFFISFSKNEKTADNIIVANNYVREILEDGSIIELKNGSIAGVYYDKNERRIVLMEGEGIFTVTKNPNRPFIVCAEDMRVCAIGTAFSISLHQQDMEVMVSQGIVRVEHTGQIGRDVGIPSLVAGQLAVIPRQPTGEQPKISNVNTLQISEKLRWKPHMLEFNAMKLSEVVAEFNRYPGTRLMIADKQLGQLTIVASFRSDNVDSFVRLLEITANVKAERLGGTIVLSRTQQAGDS